MTAKTEKVLKKLITISRKLKAQGHDLFVEYHPQVERVDWRLHVGGWDCNKKATAEYYFYSDREEPSESYSLVMLHDVLKEFNIKIGK